MKWIILFLNIHLLFFLENPGRNNIKYPIGSYYGSRYLCNNQITSATKLQQTYLVDDPVIVYWSNGLFIHEASDHLLWLADRNDHTIKIITDSK